MSSNCFLVADEVGLGKTIVACAAVHEIGKRTGRARVLYVASNSRIAKKNIQEFQSYYPVKKAPAAFQQATVNQIIKAFGYEKAASSCPNFHLKPIEKMPDRLSMYYMMAGDVAKNDSFALSFSPITSFKQPSKMSAMERYDGESHERQEMIFVAKSALSNSASVIGDALRVALMYEGYNGDELTLALQNIIRQLELPAKELRALHFTKLRRYFCNANALLFDPDILVLDEIQRFRSTLEHSPQGYSILQMVNFLNEIRAAAARPPVKVILLSATPYRFNDAALTQIWDLDEQEEIRFSTALEGTKEDPFQDFAMLKKVLKQYGGEVDGLYLDYISRTQRSFFFTEDDRKLFENTLLPRPDSSDYRAHLNYLSSLYSGVNDDFVRIYATHTPNFWEFNKGYKSLEGLSSTRYAAAGEPKNHLLLRTLLRHGLPHGAEELLWVPPILSIDLKGPFAQHKNLGKTLVFTRHHMAAKSAAALTSRVAQERLPSAAFFGDPDIQFYPDDFPVQCILGTIAPTLHANYIQQICQAVGAFFNREYSKKAIYAVAGSFDRKAVVQYCHYGDFESAMGEYRALFGSDLEYISQLLEVLVPPSYGKYGNEDINDEDKTSQEYSAAVYYTDDVNDNDGHDRDYQGILCNRFNSPFYPLIMSVTATAQEGLDMHKYADKVMHWQPAMNANAFQQREGRIDRPMSITIRRRFFELCGNLPNFPKNSQSFFSCMSDPSCVASIYAAAKSRCEIKSAKKAGIFPRWYIPALSENSAKILRILAPSAFDRDYDIFSRLLEAAKQYPLFTCGAKRTLKKEEICAFFGTTS